MKKRGLIGDTLGIVLAIIGIALLLYLSLRVAGVFIDNNRIDQAKGVLNELEGAIKKYDTLKEHKVLIFNPKDWYLFSVTQAQQEKANEDKPPCYVGNCLCICKYKSKEDCSSKSICVSLGEIEVSVSGDIIEFDELLSVSVAKNGENSFSITRDK